MRARRCFFGHKYTLSKPLRVVHKLTVGEMVLIDKDTIGDVRVCIRCGNFNIQSEVATAPRRNRE
jgi:hypothetical protein